MGLLYVNSHHDSDCVLTTGAEHFRKGHDLNHVWEVHVDILRVWNFNDPRKVCNLKC